MAPHCYALASHLAPICIHGRYPAHFAVRTVGEQVQLSYTTINFFSWASLVAWAYILIIYCQRCCYFSYRIYSPEECLQTPLQAMVTMSNIDSHIILTVYEFVQLLMLSSRVLSIDTFLGAPDNLHWWHKFLDQRLKWFITLHLDMCLLYLPQPGQFQLVTSCNGVQRATKILIIRRSLQTLDWVFTWSLRSGKTLTVSAIKAAPLHTILSHPSNVKRKIRYPGFVFSSLKAIVNTCKTVRKEDGILWD